MNYRLSKKISYLSFVLPAFIIYIAVTIFPVFWSAGLSLFKWKGYGPLVFQGLGNYVKMFKDPVFWIGFRNNVLIVLISVFGQIPLGLLLAYMIHRKMVKGGELFEILIFLPITISSVIIAQLWNQVFSPVGIIAALVKFFTGKSWIMRIVEDKNLAIIPILFVLLWQQTSLYMVIFLANLQRIPDSLLEAAELEGATDGKIFLRIIVPMLGFVIFINSVLAISGSFKSFDLIYSMTRGGPAHYTEVIANYMYTQTFVSQNYGYGSALAIIIIIFTAVALGITRGVTKIFKME
jgi:multiple sugar transport system permease protein/raffinose/stachyose/melibiose transport system permease protein